MRVTRNSRQITGFATLFLWLSLPLCLAVALIIVAGGPSWEHWHHVWVEDYVMERSLFTAIMVNAAWLPFALWLPTRVHGEAS